MPANPKYLATTGQRFLKLTAGIIGGYFVSVLFHLVVAKLFSCQISLLVTGNFSIVLLWVFFLILPYLVRNGWRIWAYYGLIILLCLLILYI